MRIVLALIVALFALPAAAAEWGHYVNERFGVEADVPPGFEPGEPPVNGDGLAFRTPTAELAIYGSFLVTDEFEAEAELRGLVEENPDDDWVRFALGRSLERQSRYTEALPHLRLAAVMSADPEHELAVLRVERLAGRLG